MFDGKALTGWKSTDFAGHGEVSIEEGAIRLGMGDPLTGLNWTNAFPKASYEIRLEAMKLDGSDFFCALTFPVADSHCTLIVGGWGGGVVGLSSIDGMDASENETTQYMDFPKKRWFKIRLRVTPEKIQAWVDEKQIINQTITDRRISLRAGEIDLSRPLGIASYQTTALIKNIEWRRAK